jgi:hypothetical protein
VGVGVRGLICMIGLQTLLSSCFRRAGSFCVGGLGYPLYWDTLSYGPAPLRYLAIEQNQRCFSSEICFAVSSPILFLSCQRIYPAPRLIDPAVVKCTCFRSSDTQTRVRQRGLKMPLHALLTSIPSKQKRCR